MERSKPRTSTDELAKVKATAWAWNQHGSGSEGKPMSEFDLTRTCRAPKPSRYKLEATGITDDSIEGSNLPSLILSPIDANNSLLDEYEIRRISLQLDYFIKSNSANFHREYRVNDEDRPGNMSSPDNNKDEKKKKKKESKFWLRHAVICGTREDVVETGALRGGRRLGKHVEVSPWLRHAVICGTREDVVETGALCGGRRLGKHVEVVGLTDCRPRTTHTD